MADCARFSRQLGKLTQNNLHANQAECNYIAYLLNEEHKRSLLAESLKRGEKSSPSIYIKKLVGSKA